MKKFISILSISFSASLFGEQTLANLHQEAERAMAEKEFRKAKSAYEKLMHEFSTSKKNSPKNADWNSYIDAALRLSRLYQNSEEFEKAEALLTGLAQQNCPTELHSQILMQLARIKCSQNEPESAFLLLNEIKKSYPQEKWRGEERSFYLGLTSMLNAHFEALLQKAEIYFTAEIYNEAIPLYEKTIAGIESGCFPAVCEALERQIRYRLAVSYFADTQFDKTLSLIEQLEKKEEGKPVEKELIYLEALIYRERNEFEKAVNAFQNYLEGQTEENLPHFFNALFELGLINYKEHNWERAKEYFQKCIKAQNPAARPELLSKLYLARIYHNEKNMEKADELLTSLLEGMEKSHPLFYEISYLKGTLAYEQGLYLTAIAHLENSVPYKQYLTDVYNPAWAATAFYQMGVSYLRLGDDFSQQEEAKSSFFDHAERLFSSLEKSELKEKAMIALAKLYIQKKAHFPSLDIKERLMLTLSPAWVNFSLEGQLDALLLLAEGASDYDEKNTYYSIATHPKYLNCQTYGEGWYFQGLNHFKEGLKKGNEGKLFFEEARLAFEKAFDLFQKEDRQKASEVLKLELESGLLRETRESLFSSLAILEGLLKQYEEIAPSMDEKSETLYLRGLVSSKLALLENKEKYFALAVDSLKEAISLGAPNGVAADALNVLATLYYQKDHLDKAYEHFEELAGNYPLSTHAAKALFAISEIGEKLLLPEESIAKAKENVYTSYPDSSYAPSCFFNLYPLNTYEKGEAKAIAHLQLFPEKFPHSPICIAAYYLLGMEAKKGRRGAEAKDAFVKSISSYEKTEAKERTPFFNFRIRSLLEMGKILMEEGKPQGVDLLCYLEEEIDEIVLETQNYLPTYQECGIALVQGLIRFQNSRMASFALKKILGHFRNLGIHKGFYLSKAWQLGAQIATDKREYETALECLKIAETTGEKHLPAEEILGLWMMESACYQELGQYMLAMRTLSKIINEDVVSPLRLEAMYKRAVLYQLQGRDELAVRQLEAVAKKGGSWGERARDTLRSQYEMHTSRSWISYE